MLSQYPNGVYYVSQVALANGIVMGGGSALVVPAKFSIVTEKTVRFVVSL